LKYIENKTYHKKQQQAPKIKMTTFNELPIDVQDKIIEMKEQVEVNECYEIAEECVKSICKTLNSARRFKKLELKKIAPYDVSFTLQMKSWGCNASWGLEVKEQLSHFIKQQRREPDTNWECFVSIPIPKYNSVVKGQLYVGARKIEIDLFECQDM
jgi:hypothetical protein